MSTASRWFCAARVALWVGAVLCAGTVSAQSYPTKPVRVVVPYPPGGTTDLAARLLSERLGKSLGQGFVVDNKAGGTGMIGANEVLRQPADGYTLLVNDTSFAIQPSVQAQLKYKLTEDFVPVTTIASTPVALVVAANSPYKTLPEFIAAAKAKPGALEYGAGGYGGSTHLAFAVFNEQAGVDITNIPYKGAGEAMIGLLSGSVKALIAAAPSVATQLKSGKVRALAITGDQRLPLLPDVPTFAEAGLPGFKVMFWFGLVAPKGTPQPVIQKLYESSVKAINEPSFKQSLELQGALPGGIPPAQFKSLMEQELKTWSAAAHKAGVKPQ